MSCTKCFHNDCRRFDIEDVDDEESFAAWKEAAKDCTDRQNNAMREAIAAWPKVYAEVTDDGCMHSNADEANAARAHARRVAGLEEP